MRVTSSRRSSCVGSKSRLSQAFAPERNRTSARRDGPKDYYFCDDCEQRFGRWENEFASRVFAPLHDETRVPPLVYPYESWCLAFSVSVSWRVLLHNREKHGFEEFSTAVASAADRAYSTWCEFLVRGRPHPGEFEQHLLPLGLITRAPFPVNSSFFNRYAVRTVDHDLPHTDDSMLVYSKLGKFAFFGFIFNCRRSEWLGTKLHVKRGTFEPSGTLAVPTGIIAYLSPKADDAAASLASMSDTQKRKVHTFLAEKPMGAESLRAFERDVAVFGPDARFVTDPLRKGD